MNKVNKKDFLYCALLIISFIFFVGLITSAGFLYGSKTDWVSQHIAFPDYFRTLYYETKNLFPDFAFNIGSGQNIYNFSYYGLYNPIILISYLFPKVSMVDYIVISTIVCCIISSILLYAWLRKKGNSELVSFAGAFMFLFSSAITFHSHRHVMFINYMPFLILGLFGVDLKLKKKKSWLLILSILLMILTSYYFSVGGIICLGIYGIYEYISLNKKVTLKQFIKDGISFAYPFVLGIMSSAILIIPTFMTLIGGRSKTSVVISWLDLLIPKFNTDFYLYDAYGIGLTAIFVIGLIYFIKSRKRENMFLGWILLSFMLFSIFVYLLNGGMYIEAKVLLPFIPLCILVITYFINLLLDKKVNIKKLLYYMSAIVFMTLISNGINSHLFILLADLLIILFSIGMYKLSNKKILFVIPLLVFSFVVSYGNSLTDNLVVKKEFDKEYINTKQVIDKIIEKDDGLYRINTYLGQDTNNNIYGNINNNMVTVYSSLSNQEYNEFYYDVFNNNIQSRNRAITSNTSNILFNIFSGNKYMVTKSKTNWIGYDYVEKVGKYYIYKNDSVLPLFYVNYNTVNKDELDKLGYPYNTDILINNVVIDGKGNNDAKSNIIEREIDYKRFELNGLKVDNIYGLYKIDVKNRNHKIYYNLDDSEKNKIIFVRFIMEDSANKDLSIKINGNINKITKEGWKYHNGNYVFDYVVSTDNLDRLTITLNNGHYEIHDIKMYVLDYDNIKDIRDNIDELHISKKEENLIRGEVQVKEDGYFVTSIPYDPGFVASIDGWDVPIEKVNNGFIGFKVSKGYHQIILKYNAPYKEISFLISVLGVCISAIAITLEWKR